MNIAKLVKQAKNMMGAKHYQSGALDTTNNRQQEGKREARFVLTSALLCLIALEPSVVAAAADANAFGNIENVATRILGFVTGTFGRTVATIAVVVLGMMAMFGKLAWDHAIKVIFGIAIVFGAASIINALGGNMVGAVAG